MKQEPTITEGISGYTLRWENLSLTAIVRRVRVGNDGQVKGELEICQNGQSGLVYLVPPTQFNFSSEPTRAKYAKQIKEKIGEGIEWREIFDYLCLKVQELSRAGDNFVEIYAELNAPAPEKLLGTIIYKNVQNVIFGEKGSSKSTLAYLFAVCVGLPWGDNPLGLIVPDRPIKTMILDWETDQSIFEYYLSRLARGMDIPACPIYYRRCTLPLRDDIEAIEHHIEETGAELLIIDSLGAAAGGERAELKGSESALLFNSALRKLKVSSLILGQTSKSEGEKKKTIFGSTYFTYYARNIFELCRGEDDSNVLHLGLFHRENNLGKKQPAMGLRMEFDDITGGISVAREPLSISEFAEKVSTSQKILELLKNGAMSQKDMKEVLDVSYPNLAMAIKRLARQKRVIKLENKEWGLLEALNI